MSSITEAVSLVEERIEAACIRAGRKRADVQLMGVSKFHSLNEVEEAYSAGLRVFGENRVQEAAEKFTALKKARADVKLHLIGRLQRNKAKVSVGLFDCIHSVDRESLIDELGKQTDALPTPFPILLEMHTAEDSKSGFPDRDSLCAAAEKALSYHGLIPCGLMTMAPYTADESSIRTSFRTLVALQHILEDRFPGHWATLSMGMTNDFEIAIEEGSTLVRVGTAIFGTRQ
jgi:pyridoxal phosphate enzyme (YggS family)